MTIVTILILAVAAMLIRLIFRTKGRGLAMFTASIVAIFWLQPAMPIRNLDFWLPTATLVLAVLCWVITAAPEERRWKRIGTTLGVLSGLVLLIGLTRYLSLKGIVTASQPPPTWQVLTALTIVGLCVALLLKIQKTLPALLWISFGLLIVIFVVLKLPWLAEHASAGLRFLMGQSTAHASAVDLRWLGFSYVAFRLIHTIRDRQSGRLPNVTLQEYVTYIIFFPVFSAGPIDRIERFITDLRQPVAMTAEDFGEGGKRLVLGLFKKFALADSLALIALNATNAGQVHGAGWTWLLLVAFSLQIYLDFSGYTDIAIGMGRWLGVRLPENFNGPYLKPNLTQFWNNWHMTLTQWFRGYYFNPLTRSLRSAKKPLPPTAILLLVQVSTMVLIGLWHGMTLNFVIWGLWHGVGLFIQNRWSEFIKPRLGWMEGKPVLKGVVRVLNVLVTFGYVALGWVWFALPSPQIALTTFSKLFGG